MSSESEADNVLYVTQVYFCAMYAVVVWDWLVSLPREWRFIWKTHWTPVKAAYLFCRYWVIAVVPYLLYCFVVDHSRETCERIYRYPVALAMWNQVGSESVLLIRTYAFFNRNVYVLWGLIAAISGVVAYQIYVDATQMLLLPFFKPPYDKGPCFPMSKPHAAHLLGFFIAPLLFDTIVTFMTIIKAFAIRRCNGGPNSRLIQTFLREGVFYYIMISIANLINGIFYLQPRQVISAINIPLSVMMAPVLACRLILDLRERGSETVSHSEGTGIAAFTTKSGTRHQCSPFTPPHPRSKSVGFGYGNRHTRAFDSNIVLSTVGSVAVDPLDISIEQDVSDFDNSGLGFGLADLGSLSTAIGDSDSDLDTPSSRSPGPGFRTLEMGFRPGRVPSLSERGVSGIRVDVEKATATM
ncbi:hypothetical protein Moror_16439 [Moniliophthora roreri MCA 2997]|uniref:DUF6533 domain-containing protein n=1 Tax=Moniliophthora roreri (strain MCA 2997) TaxID=1381753 RepID=V2WVP2_MONRO|nr:hypothetical protein Moror_16439 [Moniliophthora roreri MCA 2997]